jgi:hypothetical protein
MPKKKQKASQNKSSNLFTPRFNQLLFLAIDSYFLFCDATLSKTKKEEMMVNVWRPTDHRQKKSEEKKQHRDEEVSQL